MKLTYDPRYNIAYIRFHEGVTQVEAVRLSDEMTIDLAPDGTVYGIELLNANEQLRSEDGGNLVIANQATGEHQTVALSG